MDTRSTEALRERVTQLEVLVGGPIDSGDGHTIFDRLQSLSEGHRDLRDQFAGQAEPSSAGDMAEILENLQIA